MNSVVYRLEARDSAGELIGVRERPVVDGTIKEHNRIWCAWKAWVNKHLPHCSEVQIFTLDNRGEKCHHIFKA